MEKDPYRRQKDYQARLRAKAEIFDYANRLRMQRIRTQLSAVRSADAGSVLLDILAPYYLSIPTVQTVILPKWDGKAYVAEGDDWNIVVTAYALTQETDFPFRLTGHLRGREVVYRDCPEQQDYYRFEVGHTADLLRKTGLWVSE